MPEGAPTQAIKRVSRSTNRTENGYTLSSLILCKSLSWDILRAMPKAAIPSTRKEDTVSRCSLLHLWRRAHRRSAALIFREATVFQSACKATKMFIDGETLPMFSGSPPADDGAKRLERPAREQRLTAGEKTQRAQRRVWCRP